MPADMNTRLDAWSKAVDAMIPVECPECGGSLREVRFVADRDTTTVQLTGASWSIDLFKALCPACDHELMREAIPDAAR